MRKIKLFTLVVILNLFLVGNIIAQISYGGKPISFDKKISVILQKSLPTVTMDPVNVSLLEAEDLVNEHNKEIPWRFGQNLEVNYSLGNSGQWEYLPRR